VTRKPALSTRLSATHIQRPPYSLKSGEGIYLLFVLSHRSTSTSTSTSAFQCSKGGVFFSKITIRPHSLQIHGDIIYPLMKGGLLHITPHRFRYLKSTLENEIYIPLVRNSANNE
jgi:hypothetical protein